MPNSGKMIAFAVYFILRKKENPKKVKAKKERQYIASIELLYRAEILFAALSLTLATIYSIGAWQSFMDSTLSMVLNILSITSLADIFLSIIVIAREALAIFSKRRAPRIFIILSSLLFLIISIFLLFFAHALIAISEGFSA